ncbi:MAG: hypothetical protein LC632_05120 [Xanthomonadaceae bacterium]|nr:hypothetical protein [Xanthomonadaceae bacterium]
MKANILAISVLAGVSLLVGCDNREGSGVAPTGTAEKVPAADHFMRGLAEHCGEAFRGEVVRNVPEMDEDPFAGKELVMHIRECSDERIRIPFHVGDDHSRTWVLTRTDYGLQLKHDHRHEDGSPDTITMYGGDSRSGSGERQEFPIDEETIELFRANELPDSVTNVWAIEIVPGERFMYELSRPGGRLFQVEFDLSNPVDEPPPPWGATP